MIPRPVFFVIGAGLMLFSGPAASGNADSGLALAQSWCVPCHVVAPDQEQASDIAPPFVQIANDPARSTMDIAVWLVDPHPPMPDLNLGQDEIDDLIAYFETLKAK